MINYIDLSKWYNKYHDKIDNSIVRKVYRTYDGYIFELYKKGLEKKYLYLIPGKYIFLGNEKITINRDNFTLRLKKDFMKKRIKIYLEKNDKVIKIEDDIIINLELFPNGLIVITDRENKILYANKYKDFGIRKISKNEIYKRPPTDFKIFDSFNEFYERIINSNKRDIVRCLAIDIGLGGKYSEYILNSLNIDKNKSPKEMNKKEIEEIYKKYLEIINSEKCYYDKWYDDPNDCFFELFKEEIEKKEREEEEKIKRIIEERKKQIEILNKEKENLEKIAEFLTKYNWIFRDYDIERIKKEFKDLGIDINIKRDGYKLIIEIDNKYLEEEK